MPDTPFPHGLYESLVTDALATRLEWNVRISGARNVDPLLRLGSLAQSRPS